MPTRGNNSVALPATDKAFLEPSPDSVWSSVFNALPDCISIHSVDGQILWANNKLCDLYGKSLTELQDLSCEEAFQQSGLACPHTHVVSTGVGAQLGEKVVISDKTFSVRFEPLCDDSGRTRGFIRLMRDDTSERRMNSQLRQAERFATLGQLLSGVAHDVGTPLNVISGYAEFLLMRTKPEGQGYKELNAILEQTRRIASVISQALDLSRVSQGRVDAIEIKALLSDSLVLVGHFLRRADVKGSITCRTTPPLIYGEAPQLRQAFFNLLVNAAQQVGGGGRLNVEIEEKQQVSGFVGFTIEGTEATGTTHDFSGSMGSFLSEEQGETLGIGLYLTKTILDEAGAKITFTSGENDKGLTVYLPIKPPVRVHMTSGS
jgi:nitrogen-specific signal transduction histidine kinase